MKIFQGWLTTTQLGSTTINTDYVALANDSDYYGEDGSPVLFVNGDDFKWSNLAINEEISVETHANQKIVSQVSSTELVSYETLQNTLAQNE